MCAVATALMFALPPCTCDAARPVTADAYRIMFPLVTEATLDAGHAEFDHASGAYAVRIKVNPPEGAGGWGLYVRAKRPAFSPLGQGKPASDMSWKLDHENMSAYRRLDNYDALVLERPGGGAETVMIDLVVDLGWCTEPGRYTLDLVFTVAYK